MAGKEISGIYCWKIESDGLHIYLASSERGAARVSLSLDRGEDCTEFFKVLFPEKGIIKDRDMNLPLEEAVKAAFDGNPLPDELPLDISCTPFQMMAWKAISRIPFGETRTYGEVAMMLGKPGGARAVGQAMNRNPLPFVFP
jgi:O6-methylguanine-DNA--protein-cysteine methyltransferase